MSRINSHDRNLRIVVTAATILLGLSIADTAEAFHPPPHNNRDHRGMAATPPGKGTIDPAKSVVRDHRTPVGSGASAIPNAGKRQ